MRVFGCGECGWEAPVWWTVDDLLEHTGKTGHQEFLSVEIAETPFGWKRWPPLCRS